MLKGLTATHFLTACSDASGSLPFEAQGKREAVPTGESERKIPQECMAMTSERIEVNAAAWRHLPIVVMLLMSLMIAGPAAAQKKKKKDDTPPTPPTSTLPDEQRIDYAIGQMIGAWQVGDIAAMHKYYADDVSVVAGTWTAPAIGWANYVAGGQSTRRGLR